MTATVAVRDVVLAQLEPDLRARGLDPAGIADDVDLLGEGLVDSFGLLELVTRIEKEFGLQLDFDDVEPETLTVLGRFCEYVESQLGTIEPPTALPQPVEPLPPEPVAQEPAPVLTSPDVRETRAPRRAFGRLALAAYLQFVRARNKLFSLSVAGGFQAFGKDSVIQLPVRLKNTRRIVIGNGVFIAANTWLQVLYRDSETPAIIIGDGTTLAGGCVVSAAMSVRIGSHVGLSRNVYVADHTHEYQGPTELLEDQGITQVEPVEIGDGAWIGENAFVFPGVRIGRRAVVSANSVVTSDVPAYTVVAGQPARVVRRFAAS